MAPSGDARSLERFHPPDFNSMTNIFIDIILSNIGPLVRLSLRPFASKVLFQQLHSY
jgi:hypothetical protein